MTKAETEIHGQQAYPQYDALWHLRTLGVLDENDAPVGWSANPPDKPTRVAIIDTSAGIEHPNLRGVINEQLSLDLFSARLGSFPYLPEGQETLGNLALNWETDIADGLPRTTKLLAEFVDRLSSDGKPYFNGVQPCTSSCFSGHGTSIAGLVGARPCITTQLLPTGEPAPLPLPYTGVDPMCEIVQISTNFDPEPEGLILAFLYADLIGADVVLLPRNIADPHRMVPELGEFHLGDETLTDLVRQTSTTDEKTELWSELAALIVNVSDARPVVCAAGNANEENAIYPANLASEHNGIISVGSVNAKGFRSSYSVTRNITVMAPSNDAEAFDAAEVRLDEQDPHYDPVGVPEPNDNHKYSSYDIISTDVPGPAGYSDSAYHDATIDGALREFGSYYCRFGGTSAASALVAGFLALGRSTNSYQGGAGIEAKTWLLDKCHAQNIEDEEFQVPCWSGEPVFPDS